MLGITSSRAISHDSSCGCKFRRFAHNQPSRYNQGRRWLLPGSFYHSNQELHCTSPYSLTILPHGREWRDDILAEINTIKTGKGYIVWNMQAMFVEGSQYANCHHIAGSNNGSKVMTLVEQRSASEESERSLQETRHVDGKA